MIADEEWWVLDRCYFCGHLDICELHSRPVCDECFVRLCQEAGLL